MNINPILKREITVQSRSLGLPLLVLTVNGLLFLAGLSGIFGLTARMRYGIGADYGDFLLLYALVLSLSFLLLLFVTPSLTAGSISGERAAKTLDIMLTTQLGPAGIILGRLSASGAFFLTLLFSSIPPMLLPLLYGGVSVFGVLGIWTVFALTALLLLSVGIFASTLSGHTARTTAAAYGIVFGLCAGLPAICFFLAPFLGAGSRYMGVLLLLDPVFCVGKLLLWEIGREQYFYQLMERLVFAENSAFLRYFVPLSLLAQLSLSFILLVAAVLRITPRRRRQKPSREWS